MVAHFPFSRFLCIATLLCLSLGTACSDEKVNSAIGKPDSGYSDGGNILDPPDSGESFNQVGAPCSTVGDCAFGLICHQGYCFDTTGICGKPDIDDINAGVRDSDCDGLTDIEEFSARYFVNGEWKQTDPNNPDTDGDGILDGVELGRTSSPDPCCAIYFQGDADPSTTTSPVNPDTDGDGILDGIEDTNRNGRVDPGETDPNKRDTDGDGIYDNAELNGTDNSGFSHGFGPTDPTKADTDGDGCLDGAELSRGTNPNDPTDCSSEDTDGDGLSDDLERLLGTDPNNPDTDGDGLTDGAEYFGTDNKGRSHGFGPTNPLKKDTDGDGLSDYDEIYGTYGYVTNPNNPDTDGDGLNDGQEIRLGTDPTKKDTDGDGCEDGYEIQYSVQFGLDPLNPRDCPPAQIDSDCDGLTDDEEIRLGTNPHLRDTDGDGLWDGYEMGVTYNPDPFNCDQQNFLNNVYNPTGITTDPLKKDTDGDGLSDHEEIFVYHTDPNNPDTDGDGLTDGAEIHGTDNNGISHGYGPTDPLKPDTDGDGIPDGAEIIGGLNPNNPSDGNSGVVNQACAKPRSISEKGVKNADISLVFPTTFTTTSVLSVSGKERGVMVYDPSNKVVGFALELTSSSNTIALQETIGRALVNNTSTLTSAMAQSFTSWDGYPSAIGYYEQSDTGTDLVARATAIVKQFLGSSVSGTLSNTASVKGPFKLQLQYLHRKDSSKIHRTIVVGALAQTAASETALLEVSDLAGGSALAQYGDTHPLACEKVTSSGNSMVDFIWVVDYSFSMDPWQEAVALAADAMAAQLNLAPIDWRIAVIYHDTDRPYSRRRNPTFAFTKDIDAFKNQVKVTANGYSPERMFAPIKQMFEHESNKWLPSAANSSTKLRTGAKVVIVWLSDAKEQTASGVCDTMSCCYCLPNAEVPSGYTSCSPSTACNSGFTAVLHSDKVSGGAGTASWINPARGTYTMNWANYFANLPGGMGKAFVAGIVLPEGDQMLSSTGSAVEEKVTSEYRDVITALGGIEMNLRNSQSYQQGISQIITSAVGQATSTKLKKPPIAASIKVAVSDTMGTCTKSDVPRSRTNGFDFDGMAQTLVFYGNCRPTNGAQLAVSYRYWEDLTDANPTYRDPITCQRPLVPNALGDACVCTDCGGCDAGLACNRTSCECVCPLDCNGGCTGNLSCDRNTCSCTCEVNATCGDGHIWDGSNGVCDCICPSTQTCPAGQYFSQSSCSCECLATCGPNEIFDPVSCTCGCPSQENCPIGYTFNESSCGCECDMNQIDCSVLGPFYAPDSARCGCICEENCGNSCAQNEYCHPARCECVPIIFN